MLSINLNHNEYDTSVDDRAVAFQTLAKKHRQRAVYYRDFHQIPMRVSLGTRRSRSGLTQILLYRPVTLTFPATTTTTHQSASDERDELISELNHTQDELARKDYELTQARQQIKMMGVRSV